MRSRPTRAALIPARYGSTRFPGKPLALLGGKPLLLHVVDRVRRAGVFDTIWVATDDERIRRVVRDEGCEAFLTRADHTTGTERIAELAARLPDESIVFNVQGDEPLVPPELLQELVECLQSDASIEIVTAAHPQTEPHELQSPHVVKVVVDAKGDALYFSRAPIPYASTATQPFLRHVGLYGFRLPVLLRLVKLGRGRLEEREGLEQLRALENGIRIRVVVTSYETVGVDTPEDLKAVANRLQAS